MGESVYTQNSLLLPALLRDDQSAIKIFEGGGTNIAILPPHTDKVVNIPLELHLGLVNAQNVLKATSSSVTLNGNSGNLHVTTPLFPTGVFGEDSDASHPYKNAFDGDLDTVWKPSGCSLCGIIFTGIDRYSTASSLRITCSRSSCPASIAVYGSSALDPPAHNGTWALVKQVIVPTPFSAAGNQTQTIPFRSVVAYKHYKIVISSTAPIMAIGEISLLSTVGTLSTDVHAKRFLTAGQMLKNAKKCPTKNMDREITFNATYMTLNGTVRVGSLYVHTDDNADDRTQIDGVTGTFSLASRSSLAVGESLNAEEGNLILDTTINITGTSNNAGTTREIYGTVGLDKEILIGKQSTSSSNGASVIKANQVSINDAIVATQSGQLSAINLAVKDEDLDLSILVSSRNITAVSGSQARPRTIFAGIGSKISFGTSSSYVSTHKHLNVGSANTIDFSYVSRHDNYNLAATGGLQMRSSNCLVGASASADKAIFEDVGATMHVGKENSVFNVSNISLTKTMRLKKCIPNTWGAKERSLLPVNSSFRLTENSVSNRMLRYIYYESSITRTGISQINTAGVYCDCRSRFC